MTCALLAGAANVAGIAAGMLRAEGATDTGESPTVTGSVKETAGAPGRVAATPAAALAGAAEAAPMDTEPVTT